MAATSSQTIGRIYAEAIFELAQEHQQTESVREELEQIAELIRTDQEFSQILQSPAIGHDKKSVILEQVFTGRVSDLVLDFLTHPDLSYDLAIMCRKKNIPIVSSGKKTDLGWVLTPPT